MRPEEVRIGMRARYTGGQFGDLFERGSEVTVNGIYPTSINVMELSGTSWTVKAEELEDLEPRKMEPKDIPIITKSISTGELCQMKLAGWTAGELSMLREKGII